MKYRGQINLDRELTFTQAGKLYTYIHVHKFGLSLSSDGRSILALPLQDTAKPEDALACLLAHMIVPLGLRAIGVIAVDAETEKEESYEIIVIKNMVKKHKDGQITTVDPIER